MKLSDLPQRLVDKIQIDEATGCWLWTASLNHGGYGKIRWNGIGGKLAHKVVFEFFNGPRPLDMQLDHLCRTRRCVNPQHLEAVTVRENCLRRGIAGRVRDKRGRFVGSAI